MPDGSLVVLGQETRAAVHFSSVLLLCCMIEDRTSQYLCPGLHGPGSEAWRGCAASWNTLTHTSSILHY